MRPSTAGLTAGSHRLFTFDAARHTWSYRSLAVHHFPDTACFAAGLGEFGAVITFASNIPGQTQTLPLALYTALQSPSGDIAAMRIAGLSVLLGFMGLLAGEWMARTLRKHYGTASC